MPKQPEPDPSYAARASARSSIVAATIGALAALLGAFGATVLANGAAEDSVRVQAERDDRAELRGRRYDAYLSAVRALNDFDRRHVLLTTTLTHGPAERVAGEGRAVEAARRQVEERLDELFVVGTIEVWRLASDVYEPMHASTPGPPEDLERFPGGTPDAVEYARTLTAHRESYNNARGLLIAQIRRELNLDKA